MDSSWHPWIGSVAGSMLVGLSGIVPLLVFPDPSKLKDDSSSVPLGNFNNFHNFLILKAERLNDGGKKL